MLALRSCSARSKFGGSPAESQSTVSIGSRAESVGLPRPDDLLLARRPDAARQLRLIMHTVCTRVH